MEIFRALFVAFGAFETISNSRYLIQNNGLELAKKQHQELPPKVSREQIKTKVICMLTFGVLFLLVGLSSYLMHSFQYGGSLALLILFAAYASIEGCYYKYWKTFGFSCISILLLTLFLLIK